MNSATTIAHTAFTSPHVHLYTHFHTLDFRSIHKAFDFRLAHTMQLKGRRKYLNYICLTFAFDTLELFNGVFFTFFQKDQQTDCPPKTKLLTC